VGDICLIKEEEAFPADLLLISTGEEDGVAYI
jgi:magnesium-transporting ATPase (P-type)